ncbi:rRNA (cytidine-2'-O-)-methyltransferase, partial [Candidatus Bipolaricaulota bacterium]|nr:rRNA (cytidine-2'-O-)-methyltransferase [Candidatus Bipolaricaulota bacterium]
ERIAREEPRTVVVYESPHRLLATLEDLVTLLPERSIILARELTKRYEEFLRGHPCVLLEELRRRERLHGEWVIILEPPERGHQDRDRDIRAISDQNVAETVVVLNDAGVPMKTSCRILNKAFGIPRNEAYRMLTANAERH